MKAVVYEGPYVVVVQDVSEPRIEEPGDAVVRITTTNICGYDLHMYEGRTSVEQGKVLGHENIQGPNDRTACAVGLLFAAMPPNWPRR
jgi:glutathione-independent formaldehyde dehydrogenase